MCEKDVVRLSLPYKLTTVFLFFVTCGVLFLLARRCTAAKRDTQNCDAYYAVTSTLNDGSYTTSMRNIAKLWSGTVNV
uniref:Uncharacterized protein n=1 Tax=Ixodes ricinus TaxID=34613 RepID=A0A6B0TUT2_IXORI